MPLESAVSTEELLRHPFKTGALAIVFVSLGVFISIMLNYSSAGLLLVTLTVIPAVPLFLKIFEHEEGLTEYPNGSWIIYPRSIAALFYYFIGVVLACAIWYFILPDEFAKVIFSDQIKEIQAISASMTQWSINKTLAYFEKIFFHNLSVLILILIFSLIYGAGAVFILTWNASIIGVFVGQSIEKAYAGSEKIAERYGFLSVLHSIGYGLVTALTSIAPHGIFELLAYLSTAVAGSIMSVSISKKTYKKKYFVFLVSSFLKLVSFAILCMGVGAYIETKLIVG